MGQTVTYANKRSFKHRLAILTLREHLCGFYETLPKCVNAPTYVDETSGHTVCSGCHRITVLSGLRQCDICNREYIDKTKYQNPRYETNCPSCVEEFNLDDF